MGTEGNLGDLGCTQGQTPLHSAANVGHMEVVRLLLSVRAAYISTPDGLSPLHVAAHEGHLGVAKLLLDLDRHSELSVHTLCDASTYRSSCRALGDGATSLGRGEPRSTDAQPRCYTVTRCSAGRSLGGGGILAAEWRRSSEGHGHRVYRVARGRAEGTSQCGAFASGTWCR